MTEEQQRKALALLKSVLFDSFVETEHDRDIHKFLKEIGEIHKDDTFYDNDVYNEDNT